MDEPTGLVGVMGRIPILSPSPVVDGGLWPAKGFAGEVVPFRATAFREGHDLIGVDLILTAPDASTREVGMTQRSTGDDRWEALALLDIQGPWSFRFRAYADDYASWLHAAEIKIAALTDVELTFAIGAAILSRAAAETDRSASDRRYLDTLAAALTDRSVAPIARLSRTTEERLTSIVRARPVRSLETLSAQFAVNVERTRAGVGSWYEFFPRSEGAKRRADGSWKSGTLRSAAKRLPEVAAMGFDVLYLPPIHPIGRSFRKGPNNSVDSGPNDPGSPWAIGAVEGGHDVIHPDLGTVNDLTFFLTKAKQNGIEVALDFALQASPDHPWVREHPEWFTTLPDGSIAYAENPPKKYQDIYPINFDNDPEGIRAEALRLLRFWIARGIRIFRVDNPHTKPTDFWEWVIHAINAESPDVVFLAEAFTRPAIMNTLAKVGFQQSYTYFAWRNTKAELEEFLYSLATSTADFLRPNLFVNTPDILTEYLQFGGPPAFRIRAAIAATAAPSWGVYSGFELYENVARPGAEENIDNEKYEYRPRDFARAQAAGMSLAPYLTLLNQIRSEHPALRQLRNLDIHASDDDSILVYSKYLSGEFTRTGKPDAIIVVANVDPHSVRETTVRLDVTKFGVPEGASYQVKDLVTGSAWTWTADNYVRLDAFAEPAHILRVRFEN